MEGFKVVSAKQMAAMEAKSIEDGFSSKKYMETAGKNLADFVAAYLLENDFKKKVTLLIGKGNNGGDAYVLGMHLIEKDIEVEAYALFPSEHCSALNQEMQQRYVAKGGEYHRSFEHMHLSSGVVVDALLGTGFSPPVSEPILSVIEKANASSIPMLSIDIPSGLCGDTGEVNPIAIKADVTMFLGLPKIGFFLRDGMDHIGRLQSIDFGLDSSYIANEKPVAHILDEIAMKACLPDIKRSRHKYEAGYVLGITGSKGMMGAAKLSSLAALRTGCGIVRLFYPKDADINETLAPEILTSTIEEENISHFLEEEKRASSIYIGPGMGKSESSISFVKKIFQATLLPVLIDADGLFALKDDIGSHNGPLVLTPHKKELANLLDVSIKDLDADLITLCQGYVEKSMAMLVVKGAATFIFAPLKIPLIIYRGDPGMATAGSGDVLTGMIASFIAQKIGCYASAALGCFLHSLSGEIAAQKNTSYDVIASDLIENIGQAFQKIIHSKI